MEKTEGKEDWALSTISWYAIFVWFGASLFSQVVYMAFNGMPYDANLMLESAGPIAWIVIGLEVLAWIFIVVFFSGKVVNRLNVKPHETSS
tara:strand:+ start:582 stop:854 length:273 start_codon:yes stop_codon:yes gene_type:complete